VLEWHLSEKEMEKLDQVSNVDLGFTHDFLEKSKC